MCKFENIIPYRLYLSFFFLIEIYRYTLSGSIYRQELVQILSKTIKYIFGDEHRLHKSFRRLITSSDIINLNQMEYTQNENN